MSRHALDCSTGAGLRQCDCGAENQSTLGWPERIAAAVAVFAIVAAAVIGWQ